MAENPRESNGLIESLAALEHEQWITWSKAVAHEVSEDRRKRWETYWVPYSELDEETKEKDREWARRAAEIIMQDNGGLNAPTSGIGPARDLTLRLTVDVSDALTGLKAIRREADAAVAALKSVNEAKRERALSDYTTCELTDELARRTGVTEYYLPPEYGVNVDFGGGPVLITGPCRILINVD